MNKRETKKEFLLEQGLQVMRVNGYNGTSVKDIVDAAEVPKGSFYTYFESKEDFAIQAIDKAAREGIEQVKSGLASQQGSALEKLNSLFNSQVDGCCDEGFQVGCFLGNMCQEMADNSEAIRNKLRQVLRQQTALFQGLLEQAKAEGKISQHKDVAVMAEFLFNAWEGALMRMKASKCREPLDAFLKFLPSIYN